MQIKSKAEARQFLKDLGLSASAIEKALDRLAGPPPWTQAQVRRAAGLPPKRPAYVPPDFTSAQKDEDDFEFGG